MGLYIMEKRKIIAKLKKFLNDDNDEVFKFAIRTKFNKFREGRNVSHFLGLRRIPRYQRVGLFYSDFLKFWYTPYEDSVFEELESIYKDGCIIILMDDEYVSIQDDERISGKIRSELIERIGSDDTISVVVGITDRETWENVKDDFEQNYRPVNKLKKKNSGNSAWEGHYYVHIRGGNQNSIKIPNKDKVQLVNYDYDFASNETMDEIGIQMAYLIIHSENNELLFQNAEAKNTFIEFLDLLTNEFEYLLNTDRLKGLSLIDEDGYTICPICKERLNSANFFTKANEDPDTIELLHLVPLNSDRDIVLPHQPNYLGLGHNFCNSLQGNRSIEYVTNRMTRIALITGKVKLID